MFRTRFKGEIVAEFLPPARRARAHKVIILCDGMPSIPHKQPLVEFLAEKGYWVFYPRYRGTWESDGEFLAQSPEQDLRDVIDGLDGEIREVAFGQKFHLEPDRLFVIGGSFGGATALLASLDARVSRVVANCPVVDWSVLEEEQEMETSNPSYAAYVREAFGNAYRLKQKNWDKLSGGAFFNPIARIHEFDPRKILMFHAKDDPYIPWRQVSAFAARAGIRLKLLSRGGHLSTTETTRKYWPQIRRFFEAAPQGR